MSYFHTGTRTIIGAEAFHCPVRDGKEWDHLAMVIRLNGLLWSRELLHSQFAESPSAVIALGVFQKPEVFLIASINVFSENCTTYCVRSRSVFDHSRQSSPWAVSCQSYRVKPHEQLVPVSLTGYPASTPGLSTSWS